jgi:MinD superfamily P-loop ATPase
MLHDFVVAIAGGKGGTGKTGIVASSAALAENVLLAVTEPTVSGQHDINRVAELTEHLKIPTLVCINKWDINPETAKAIEQQRRQRDLKVAGKIHYDIAVTETQLRAKSIVEYSHNGITEQIASLWKSVLNELKSSPDLDKGEN